jgi:hypothetical protein
MPRPGAKKGDEALRECREPERRVHEQGAGEELRTKCSVIVAARPGRWEASTGSWSKKKGKKETHLIPHSTGTAT